MRTFYKWFIGLFITAILLFAALQWVAEPWLESKAHEFLTEHSAISGQAKHIEVNIFNRSIRLDSLEIQTQIPGKKDTLGHVQYFTMSSPVLRFSGIGILAYLFRDKINISKIYSSGIDIEGLRKLSSSDTHAPKMSAEDLPFTKLRIRQFQLDSLVISYLDSIKGQQTDASMEMLEGKVELGPKSGKGLQFIPENTLISLGRSRVSLPTGYYELNLKKGRLLGDQSQLLLDSLSVQPLLEKYEFSQKYGFRTDRVIGSLTSLRSIGLDVGVLLNEGDVDLDLVEIEGLAFDVFRDARLPFHPEKYEVLLQEKLRQIPFMLTMDSFLIENARILYEEKRLEHQGTGELLLENISLSGGQITNDTVKMKDVVFTTSGSAIFMGSGKMEATFNFPLGKKNGYQRVRGKLEPMSIVEVNPLLYPLTNFRVKKGYNENAFFDMELDNVAANGEIRLYYRDLHIEIVSRKRGFFNDIKNYLANQIVLNDNPLDGQFRIGHIDYTRDTQRSMFNYWWMALRSGLLESVGLSKEVLN